MLRVAELIRILQQAPANAVVTTWDGDIDQESDIEEVQVVEGLVMGKRVPVVVMGLDIGRALEAVGEPEVLWKVGMK